jgi:hypothetical protein
MKKEIDDYEQRYNKANNEGAEYDFISVCREAALLGAKYGDEWANHKEVDIAEGVVLSNPISFARKVLDKLEAHPDGDIHLAPEKK